MSISSVDMSGAITGASVAVAAPANTMGSAQSAQSTQTTGGEVSVGKVKQIIADMQGQLDSMNVSIKYTLYGENDRNVAVKVLNKETGDVIREIPPKEVQELQAQMSELVGMIFNGKG